MGQIARKRKQQTKRHYLRIVAFVALVLLFSWLFTVLSPVEEAINSRDQSFELVDESPVGPVAEASSPVMIRVPRLGIETSFEAPLGLNRDGTIEVPASYEEVGWYKYGPTPGELGPAVVLGHVDSKDGPAVFYSLGQLKEGDLVHIDRHDGSTVTFRVTDLQRHEQDDFPTELVYGDINHAGLRLITCSGVYERSSLRYTHNLIVFAELVSENEF